MNKLLKLGDQEEIPGTYWGKMWKIASLGEGRPVFKVAFFNGKTHFMHRHPNHKEIVIVSSGRIEQTILDKNGTVKGELTVGEAALIDADTPHCATALEDNTVVIVFLDGKGNDYDSTELIKQ